MIGFVERRSENGLFHSFLLSTIRDFEISLCLFLKRRKNEVFLKAIKKAISRKDNNLNTITTFPRIKKKNNIKFIESIYLYIHESRNLE